MKPVFTLISKEIKDVFLSKTALFFFILTTFIVGNSFVMAVDLYSKASGAAVNNALYASGFEPVPGVFVPTYGSLFIIFSLFLPFVIIPLISNEKRNNTISILAQLPFSFKSILISKVIAAFFFLLFVLAITIPAFIIWNVYGGHIAYGESFILILGYLLYGLVVISISLCFASLFESTANAAIFSIATIISSWVIDFAKSTNISSILSFISGYTFTKTLKCFENGILSPKDILFFLSITFLFLSMTYIFLRFDLRHKLKWASSIVIIFALALFLMNKININFDLTESHRNSFPANISQTLKRVPDIEIDIYLEKGDSRFEDYQRSFLKKLDLIRNDVRVTMMTGDALNKNYGLFVYSVNGKSDKTYSNSEEEIFPIIFRLAGIKVNSENNKNTFPGYPLVITKRNLLLIHYIYYLLIPLGFILIFIATSKNFNLRSFEK